MSGKELEDDKARLPLRRGRSDSGASLPEFALVLPLLLIMLFGIVEFGIAFNRAQAVEAAAREGARLASLSSTNAGDVSTRVNDSLVGIPFVNPPTVTISPSLCAGRQGEAVTVQVTAQHPVNIPLVFSQNVNLTGQAVFRCEA